MDEKAQAMLNAVLAKEPHELTEIDKQLIRARLHYVGKKSRLKFAEVLSEVPVEKTEEQEEENEKKSASTFPPENTDDQDGDEE